MTGNTRSILLTGPHRIAETNSSRGMASVSRPSAARFLARKSGLGRQLYIGRGGIWVVQPTPIRLGPSNLHLLGPVAPPA